MYDGVRENDSVARGGRGQQESGTKWIIHLAWILNSHSTESPARCVFFFSFFTDSSGPYLLFFAARIFLVASFTIASMLVSQAITTPLAEDLYEFVT